MNIDEKFLPDLAKICGAITGDGHIQIKEWRYLTSFYSNDYSQIILINDLFSKLFGVKGRIYTKNAKNIQYRLFIISKDVAIFLQQAQVPVGKKTDVSFSIPDWILKGEKILAANYLRGLFTAEGCVNATKVKEKIR